MLRWWQGRRRLVAVAALSVATGCGASPSTGAVTSPAAELPRTTQLTTTYRVGGPVWVNVSVATLWTSTSAPRRVDAKAVSAPVDIRGWLSAMSTAQRRGLVGRVETQVPYGDRLTVTAVRPGWLRVAAVAQPTRRDARGYPGWVPKRQVTTIRPVAAAKVATVVRTTAWLRTSTGARRLEISIGTRMPVLSVGSTTVAVATPTHGRLFVASRDVVVRDATSRALARTATSVITTARRFLGLPYLWGGRSGFAVDCSGLTELNFALHGVTIARDADDQARNGRAVALSALRPADLVFFRTSGVVTHVGIYLGSGRMLHAPRTGTLVQVGPVGRPALARRVL